jgi:hypothetical protein
MQLEFCLSPIRVSPLPTVVNMYIMSTVFLFEGEFANEYGGPTTALTI